jgi:hypothetical protein
MLVQMKNPRMSPWLFNEGSYVRWLRGPGEQNALRAGGEGEPLELRLEGLKLEDIGIGDAWQVPFRRIEIAHALQLDNRGRSRVSKP